MPDPSLQDNPQLFLKTLGDVRRNLQSDVDPNLRSSFPSEGLDQYRSTWYRPGFGATEEFSEANANKTLASRFGVGTDILQAIKRLPVETIAGIGEQVGYLLDPAEYTGLSDNFSNWFSESMKSLRDANRDSFAPIYRQNPEKVIDTTDPAWWVDNGEQLASSIAQFYVTGKFMGTGLANLAGHILGETKAAAGTAQLATAVTQTMTEGMMTASETYKTKLAEGFQYYKKQGQSDSQATENAKDLASQSAATVMKVNMLNVGFNITGLGPIFESTKIGKMLAKNAAENIAFEGAEGFYSKAANAASKYVDDLEKAPLKITSVKNTLVHALLREAPQEYTEETMNQVAQDEGDYQADRKMNKVAESPLGQRLMKSITSEQGVLSGVMGAIGGAGQHIGTVGVENIHEGLENKTNAAYRSYLDILKENGDTINLMYSKTKEDDLIKKVKESLATDQDVNAEEAKQSLFRQMAIRNLHHGLDEAFTSQLKAVVDASLSVAKDKSMSDGDNDHLYKERAREMLDSFTKVKEEYNRLGKDDPEGNQIQNSTNGMTINDERIWNYMELQDRTNKYNKAQENYRKAYSDTSVLPVDTNPHAIALATATIDASSYKSALDDVNKVLEKIKKDPAMAEKIPILESIKDTYEKEYSEATDKLSVQKDFLDGIEEKGSIIEEALKTVANSNYGKNYTKALGEVIGQKGFLRVASDDYKKVYSPAYLAEAKENQRKNVVINEDTTSNSKGLAKLLGSKIQAAKEFVKQKFGAEPKPETTTKETKQKEVPVEKVSNAGLSASKFNIGNKIDLVDGSTKMKGIIEEIVPTQLNESTNDWTDLLRVRELDSKGNPKANVFEVAADHPGITLSATRPTEVKEKEVKLETTETKVTKEDKKPISTEPITAPTDLTTEVITPTVYEFSNVKGVGREYKYERQPDGSFVLGRDTSGNYIPDGAHLDWRDNTPIDHDYLNRANLKPEEKINVEVEFGGDTINSNAYVIGDRTVGGYLKDTSVSPDLEIRLVKYDNQGRHVLDILPTATFAAKNGAVNVDELQMFRRKVSETLLAHSNGKDLTRKQIFQYPTSVTLEKQFNGYFLRTKERNSPVDVVSKLIDPRTNQPMPLILGVATTNKETGNASGDVFLNFQNAKEWEERIFAAGLNRNLKAGGVYMIVPMPNGEYALSNIYTRNLTTEEIPKIYDLIKQINDEPLGIESKAYNELKNIFPLGGRKGTAIDKQIIIDKKDKSIIIGKSDKMSINRFIELMDTDPAAPGRFAQIITSNVHQVFKGDLNTNGNNEKLSEQGIISVDLPTDGKIVTGANLVVNTKSKEKSTRPITEEATIEKPEIKLSFISSKQLVDSKDPRGFKDTHDDIKERYKDLKQLIDCIHS